MSDKPLVQQALADTFAEYIKAVSTPLFMPLFQVFFYVLGKEWNLLDKHRYVYFCSRDLELYMALLT